MVVRVFVVHNLFVLLYWCNSAIFFLMKCRLKVKEDVIAELHGNVIKKDEEIASLKSLLDEQKNKNNVS